MKVEIRLPHLPAGFSAAAARPGTTVPVIPCEFTSSEDGAHFLSLVEGFQSGLLDHVPGCPRPSQIDRYVAVIRQDLTATVAVNDFTCSSVTRLKRDVKPGEVVAVDDVLDVVRLQLDIPVPDDAGFVLLQSVGWRKSLFFDLVPIAEQGRKRTYDLGAILGSQYAHLVFQDQLKITNERWREMFRQNWFPFRFLPHAALQAMLNHAAEKWDIDEILDQQGVLSAIERVADPDANFIGGPAFVEHAALLSHAFARFRERDYKSAVAILFPRIEGVLRSIHKQSAHGTPPNAAALVATSTAKTEKIRGDATLLMPVKFREYLGDVYFRSWRPGDPPEFGSRHSVSHGVAPEDLFDRKAAAIGVLTILQLSLYL